MPETPEDSTSFFWEAAEATLRTDGVETGTMMGFPCLRSNGVFFASCDHRNGDLIVKLPEQRVNHLISAGVGEPFAPAGRVFRQWVRVPDRDSSGWRALIAEARSFADHTRHDAGFSATS
jgi:hypothetical protein